MSGPRIGEAFLVIAPLFGAEWRPILKCIGFLSTLRSGCIFWEYYPSSKGVMGLILFVLYIIYILFDP